MIPVLANVAPTTYQTGQEWFTAQPESTQLAILGRGRYDAWKRGDVSLSDMVRRVDNPTWGGSLQTARVGDLAAGRRGAFVSVPGRGAGPVMPVAPPTMPKFATVQDAQEWAKTQLELDADYSSATLDQATSINRAVFDVQQRYKGGKFIDKIEFIDENHEYTAVAIGKTIKFNRGAFSDEAIQAINSQELAKLRKLPERIQRLQQQLDESREFMSEIDIAKAQKAIERLSAQIRDSSGRFTYGNDMYDIAVHELGHAVQNDLSVNAVGGVTDFLPPSVMRQMGVDFDLSLYRRLDSIAKSKGHLISEYADTNANEYFAEAFAAYIKGDKKIIDSDLVKIFDKVMQ